MIRAILKHRTAGRLCQKAVVCLLMFGLGQAAYGQPAKLSKGEISLLPDFCQDRLNYPVYSWTDPRWAYWRGRMGDSFQHVHHYCWALVSIRRASTTSNQTQREHLYATAIRDLEYVLTNASEDFRLLPEIHVRIAESAVRLADFGKAYDGFALARQLKPGYPPAYLGWAEVLVKAGQKEAAIEILNEGLRHAPESTEMRALLKKLGVEAPKMAPGAAPTSPSSTPNEQPHVPAAAGAASEPSAPAGSAPARAAGI